MTNNPVGSYKGMPHWSVIPIKLSTQPLYSETSYPLIWTSMEHPPTPIPLTSTLPGEHELMVCEPAVPHSGLTVLLIESSNAENRPVLGPKKVSVSPGPNAPPIVTGSSVYSRSRDRTMGSSPVRGSGSPKKRTAPPRKQRKTIGGYVPRVGEFLPRGEPQGQGSRAQGGGFW